MTNLNKCLIRLSRKEGMSFDLFLSAKPISSIPRFLKSTNLSTLPTLINSFALPNPTILKHLDAQLAHISSILTTKKSSANSVPPFLLLQFTATLGVLSISSLWWTRWPESPSEWSVACFLTLRSFYLGTWAMPPKWRINRQLHQLCWCLKAYACGETRLAEICCCRT